MEFSEAQIIAIDFNKFKPEDLFRWLEQFGFWRYVSEQYITPEKSVDPRLIEPDQSPEGLYPGVIVPTYNLHEAVFVIRRDLYWKIKDAYNSSTGIQDSQEEATEQ